MSARARHRRRRLHRLEPRARARSSAATRCACSTTSRPAAARTSTGLDVEIVEGELRSYERVHNAVRGVEVVFHLGALGSVPRSVQDPLTSSAVNVEGTLNVLLAARDEGVRRVVFSSSTRRSTAEPRAADAPRRLAARPDLAVRRREARRRALLHRFSPRLRRRSRRSCCATSTSSARARARTRSTPPSSRSSSPRSPRGEPVTIHGDGEQSRDFTYVDNVVDATIRAADAAGASGRIFNVAGGAPASVNHVADAIGEILGKPVEKRYAPPRPGDIRDSWADVTAARERARLRAVGRRSRRACAARPTALLEPSTWLSRSAVAPRLIARLNMGGPALHVAYLTKGLEPRGYETTLVAGSLARGESSMSFVADELGVDVVPIPQLHREISPLYDTLSVTRLVRLIRSVRPHILHTHTAKAGAVGRVAALLAGDARPPIVVHTFHGHVLRGYFDPARTAAFRDARAARSPRRRRGSSRSARRCATTSSRSASRRRASSR